MPDKKTLIIIGRQFGSGGKAVAQDLGKRLGIAVYDNELIAKSAEASGLGKECFIRSDEKRSLFSMPAFFSPERFSDIGGSYVRDHETFGIQAEVIRGIAARESAIFVGRCADYILRDMPTLSVFISAPSGERAERVSARCGISVKEAQGLMEKKDRTRQTYYNYFTFREWGVASNYDLCINSGLFGIEGTADLIINAAQKKGLL